MRRTLGVVVSALTAFSLLTAKQKEIKVTGDFNGDKKPETAMWSKSTIIQVPELSNIRLSFFPDTLYVEQSRGRDYLIVRNPETGRETRYNYEKGIWTGRAR